MGAKRRQITYRLLGLPDPADGIPAGWTELGSFRPADHLTVVESLSERRLKGIMILLEWPDLFPENRAFLYDRLFHTYGDFLVSLKHDQPTRKDGITYGHSLKRYSADLAGYLAYLQDKAPELAEFLQSPLRFLIRDRERQRHTLIIGSSGAGKSVLMNTLIHAERAAETPPTTILLDPHGDLAEDVGRSRRLPGRQELIYLDPGDGSAPGFTVNFFDVPLRTPREQATGRLEDATIDRLAQVGTGILEMLAGGEGSMTLNMRTLLYPCLCTLLDRPPEQTPASLADLARFMDDSQNTALVERGRRSRFAAHRAFFAGGADGESGFQARSFRTTKMALYTRIQSLVNSQLFCDLAIGDGHSTIDLAEAIDSRRLLLVNLDKTRLGEEVAVTVGKFLVGLIMAHAMARPQGRRTPVHLYLDEFHHFVSPSIKAAFTELRKFGLHLTIAQQYEGQEGNSEIARAIANNTNVKMIGRTTDPGSAARLAGQLLVGEDDVRRLQIGQFYVRAGGGPSFKVSIPPDLLRPEARLSASAWARFAAAEAAARKRRPQRPETAATGSDGGQGARRSSRGAEGPQRAATGPSAPERDGERERTGKRRPKFRLPGER